jgi:pimeloyl-ACP methyl ester carboxylesterase
MKVSEFQCGGSKWGMWVVIIIGLLTAMKAFGGEPNGKQNTVDRASFDTCCDGSKWGIAPIIGILTALKVFETKPAKAKTFIVKSVGEGAPVILVPGLGCSGEVWKELEERLVQKGYRCHTLTLSGFAGVQAPDTTSIDLLTKELAEYISELKEKPIFIGHSLGGFVGLNLAVNHPALLQKLLVVDALPFLPAAINPVLTADQTKPQAEMMRSMTLKQSDEQFAATTSQTLKAMIADTSRIPQALLWMVKSDRRVFASMMHELMTTDLRNAVGSIGIPITVLGSWAAGKAYGMTEDMAIRTFETQYSAIAGVRIRIAKTAFHFIMWDEPRWLEEQVDAFVKTDTQ